MELGFLIVAIVGQVFIIAGVIYQNGKSKGQGAAALGEVKRECAAIKDTLREHTRQDEKNFNKLTENLNNLAISFAASSGKVPRGNKNE